MSLACIESPEENDLLKDWLISNGKLSYISGGAIPNLFEFGSDFSKVRQFDVRLWLLFGQILAEHYYLEVWPFGDVRRLSLVFGFMNLSSKINFHALN